MTVSRPPILTALLALALSLPAAPSTAQGDDEIRFPLTIEKVWYRNEKKSMGGLKAFKHSGDLTVTEDALELVAKNRHITIPLERLYMVSFGKMGGDVNTDWIVISFDEAGQRRIIGLKDGKGLGYGQETLNIYRQLRRAMRALGAAQFAAPEGYKPYHDLDEQLAFPIPEAWHAYVHTIIFEGDNRSWGEIVFTEVEEPDGRRARDDFMKQVARGEIEALTLDRRETTGGMSCKGFSTKARKKLTDEMQPEALFGPGFAAQGETVVTDITVEDCHGLRFQASATGPTGTVIVADVRVIADRGILFIFGLRRPGDVAEELAPAFDVMVDGVRLSVAKD